MEFTAFFNSFHIAVQILMVISVTSIILTALAAFQHVLEGAFAFLTTFFRPEVKVLVKKGESFVAASEEDEPESIDADAVIEIDEIEEAHQFQDLA